MQKILADCILIVYTILREKIKKRGKKTMTKIKRNEIENLTNDSDTAIYLIDRARELVLLNYYSNIEEALCIAYKAYNMRKGGRI